MKLKTLNNPSDAYFTTNTIVDYLDLFNHNDFCEILIDCYKFCLSNKQMELLAFVIMSNHLHSVILPTGKIKIGEITRDFKNYTARTIIDLVKQKTQTGNKKEYYKFVLEKFKKNAEKFSNQNYQVWMHDSHPVTINSLKFMKQKIKYIHNNPVKKEIVTLPEYYCYSSARNYILNDNSLIKIIKYFEVDYNQFFADGR